VEKENSMESLVITPRNKDEMRFVSELLQKIGLETRKLSDEVKENAGLALLMSQADRNDVVNTKSFKASLRK
jgi:hypothetical protein